MGPLFANSINELKFQSKPWPSHYDCWNKLFSVFFDVESEYGIGLSLTITIFALEGVAIIFSNPVYDAIDVLT
jgi:hypothetical protein